MKQSPVAIVGLSRLFREGLQLLLRRSRFAVVTKAATLAEALDGFAISRPELVICALAGGEDISIRIEQLRISQTLLEGIRIVLLTDQLSADDLRSAAAAGVHGVLSKEISSDVLQRSLDLVMLGQPLYPSLPDEPRARPAAALIPFSRPVLAATGCNESVPGAAIPVKRLFGAPGLGTPPQRNTTLSDRERQILRCLMEGAANKTIARDLQITEATVKVHIKGLLRKIRVNNRTQAAVWGLNNTDLIDDPASALHDRDRSFSPVRHAAS